MNPKYRNFALWAIIAMMLIALFNMFQSPAEQSSTRDLSYSQFLQDVESGRVQSVTIAGERIIGTYGDTGVTFQTYSPGDSDLVTKLEAQGVEIRARPESEGNSFFTVLLSWLPMIIILGVWIFFMRQMQGGGSRAMGFGKSKAKLLTEAHGRVTFDDAARDFAAKAL
ncbi:MAG: ATP-dependent metallopeptidase FtsH/Yme1/Tma family protein, partial [Pseudomonadota bacterium]